MLRKLLNLICLVYIVHAMLLICLMAPFNISNETKELRPLSLTDNIT